MSESFVRRTVRLPIFVLIFAAAASQAVAEYALAPGDVVRITVTGMPELSTAAAIDNDGMLRLPQFDPVTAAGAPLTAAQESLRLSNAGRLVRRFDPVGAPILLSVAAGEIHLSIEQYRPINVLGAVATPGAVQFRPGMTARSALAQAGGLSRLAGGAVDGGLQRAPQALAQLRTLSIERARLIAELWRHEVLLGQRPLEPAPTAAELGLGEAAAEAIIAAQRQLINFAEVQRDSERSFIEASINQIGQRADILRQQIEQQKDAVSADEEEMTRVRKLLQRGVVPNDRLLDIRRAQVQSGTRLLTTQSELERVDLDRIRLNEQRITAEPRRLGELIARVVGINARLDDITIRIASAQEELELAGISAFAVGGETPMRTSLRVYRTVADRTDALELGFDDILEPGDVVEVTLAPETP